MGTLRAAKKRKIVGYEAEMLLKGAHDDVFIELLNYKAGPADTSAPAASAPAAAETPEGAGGQTAVAEAEPAAVEDAPAAGGGAAEPAMTEIPAMFPGDE